MQAQLLDGVIAQTKALLAAGPIPGIETYCVYGECVVMTAARAVMVQGTLDYYMLMCL
jgi:hypothetical protein